MFCNAACAFAALLVVFARCSHHRLLVLSGTSPRLLTSDRAGDGRRAAVAGITEEATEIDGGDGGGCAHQPSSHTDQQPSTFAEQAVSGTPWESYRDWDVIELTRK
jgi:hypothetical protein